MKQELGNLMAEDPHQETINLLTYRLNAVSTELAAVTEQRDRLAEALEQIASTDPNWRDCILIAKEALQSLKQNSQADRPNGSV